MPDNAAALSPGVIAYLGTQRLGRLATVDPAGAPQNNPVGFRDKVIGFGLDPA